VPYHSAVRDRSAHRAAVTLNVHYLVFGGDARDAIDWTPDWTRRARGYAVYAALRELARDGFGKTSPATAGRSG